MTSHRIEFGLYAEPDFKIPENSSRTTKEGMLDSLGQIPPSFSMFKLPWHAINSARSPLDELVRFSP